VKSENMEGVAREEGGKEKERWRNGEWRREWTHIDSWEVCLNDCGTIHRRFTDVSKTVKQ